MGAQATMAHGTVAGSWGGRRKRLNYVLRPLLAFVVLVLGGLVAIGLPPPLTRYLLRWANAGVFFWQVERLTLDWRGGLIAHGVRGYRKGYVGPPAIEARRIRLGVDPLAWRVQRRRWLREVEIEGGRLPTSGLTMLRAWPAGATERGWAGAVVALRNCELLGVWVETLSGRVERDAKGLRISNLNGVVGRGEARGRLEGNWEGAWGQGWRGSFAASFMPNVLQPLWRALDFRPARIAERFTFRSTPPACTFTVHHSAVAQTLAIRGQMQANDFAYRGVPLSFANLGIEYVDEPSNAVLVLKPVVLFFGDKSATGNVRVEFDKGTAEFETVATTDPETLARLAGWDSGLLVKEVHCGGQTRLYAKGVVGYQDAALSRVEGYLEGANLEWGPIRARDCFVKLDIEGRTNRIAELRGRLYGGSFTCAGAWWQEAPTGAVAYQVKGEVVHADLKELAAYLRGVGSEQMEGRLYGRLELAGLSGQGWDQSARGQGYLSLRNGRIFRIPLFGKMSDALIRAVPGLDFVLRQTDVRIPFEIREGRVWCRDAQIEGDVLSLTARGSCTFAGGLDFDVLVRPMKGQTVVGQAVRAAVWPLSKLLQFRLTGTLDAPRWYAVNFSSDVIQRFLPEPRSGSAAP